MLENKLAETRSLNGEWEIEIAGLRGRVQVPDAWEVQGYPDVEGPAVYRRNVDVPAQWQGATVMLRFGAVSYYVEVYVNGICVGTHEGLWTPFEVDVAEQIRPGVTNRIELHIIKPADDGNRFPYRDVLVGFIPYVSTTFGGVWQDVELVAHRAPVFSDIRVAASPTNSRVAVTVELHGVPYHQIESEDRLVAFITDQQVQIVSSREFNARSGAVAFEMQVVAPQFWSPGSPYRYLLTLQISRGETVITQTQVRFGFRRLRAKGERLLLNDEPILMRGILSWGWNPKTLAPIFTDDEIRTEFRRVREMGFNLYKLCLYVPSPRVFEIADEMGMMLWLEMPIWLPRLSDHLREQAKREYADILARVHHHPSVVIYSLGCELSADMADASLLETLDTMTRGSTYGALVCDNSGSGEAYGGLSRDFADFNDYHFYCDLQYFIPLCDHFRRDWRPARPWIFGEFCDCDDYRDPAKLLEDGERPWWQDLLGKDGGIHRWAYKEQEQRIAALNLPFSDRQLVEISWRQSFLVRKHILEKVRARRDIGGYVVTGLRDTPISSSGVLDDRGLMKYPPNAFKAFNADAVLLLEQGRARVWRYGGDRPAPSDLYNHEAGAHVSFRALLANASHELSGGEHFWQFKSVEGSQVHSEGSLRVGYSFPPGSTRELSMIEFQMPQFAQAAQYILAFTLRGDGYELHNEWNMWVYPHVTLQQAAVFDPLGVLEGVEQLNPAHLDRTSRLMEMGGEVLICSIFTPAVEKLVRSGGKAIVLQQGEGALPVKALPFWRESIKLIYDHPTLEGFPHQGYTDMQFYHLATDHAFDTAALRDKFGVESVTPIIERLDARLFDIAEYLVEIKLGGGKMFASTLSFTGGAGDQVHGLASNIAGRWLLSSLVDGLAR
jgi:hypothetical protein